MKKKLLISIGIYLSVMGITLAQVPYIFKNTSAVNAQQYSDDNIYIYPQLAMPGMNGYYNTNTQSWENIVSAGSFSGPNGGTYTDANIRLDQLPKNAQGQYYLDIPQGSSGRLYIGFGGPIYTVGANNPLLDDPGNPNYFTKVETIELTIGGQIFTNTSRVDRYAYPIGEELYCNNASYYDKVGETVTHEQVIAKWKLFVNDEFQNAYDPIRDIITQMGHTPYFQEGNPGHSYFDDFLDQFFTYYSTHTLRAVWYGTEKTATVSGNTLTWNDGTTFQRSDFNLEDIVGGAGAFNQDIGQILGVCLNRGVIRLTEDVQVWDDESNYFQESAKNDYTHFFHSDFVSFEAKTYALAYDDVFDYSSTQSCQGTADSVVISLGGFGTEHEQILTSVYIDPQDEDIEQYQTIALSVKGLDQGLIDMSIPTDAVISWSTTDDNNTPVDLIDENGLFGPTDNIGTYLVSVVVDINGTTYTAQTSITVNEAGSTGQICTGDVGNNASYQIEVLDNRVYLTLITTTGWIDGGYTRLHYGESGELNEMPSYTLIPNQPYHIDGFFLGEELYFYVFTEFNGGTTIGSPIHIESIGTCEGLEIVEEIINITSTPDVTIESTETYQINVSGLSNLGNNYTYPHSIFTSPLQFVGEGVDASGLFTPINGAGIYTINITYENILTSITIEVTGDPCQESISLGNDFTLCEGQDTTLSLPTGTYTGINWSGTGSTFISDIQIASPIFSAPLGNGDYELMVEAIDENGCDVEGNMTITVQVVPTATLPTALTLCEGSSDTLITANVSPTGGTGNWVNANKTSEITGLFTPISTGQHSISYDYTYQGCTAETSILLVNIVEEEQLDISYTTATVCDYSSALIPTLSHGIGQFSIFPVDGSISSSGHFDPQNSPAGTYEIIYQQTGTTCPLISDTTIITVYNRPTIDLTQNPTTLCSHDSTLLLVATPSGGTFSGPGVIDDIFHTSLENETVEIDYNYTDPITTCAAEETNFTLTITHTSPPESIELPVQNQNITGTASMPSICPAGTALKWYNSASTSASSLGQMSCYSFPFVDVSPQDGLLDEGNYTVYASQTINGCESTPSAMVLSVSACTTTAPTTNLTSIAICQEDLLPLLSVTSNGTAIQWTYLDNIISTGDELPSDNLPFPIQSTGIYTVGVSFEQEDIHGLTCRGPQTMVEIEVLEKPTVSIAGVTTSCSGDIITLSASSLTTTGAYTWSFTDDSSPVVQHTPLNSSTFSVIETTSSGCSDTAFHEVTVLDMPMAQIQNSTSILCEGESIELIATPNTSPSFEYQWYKDGSEIVGTATSYTLNTVGSYTLEVSNNNTCTATSSPLLITEEIIDFEVDPTTKTVNSGETVSLNATSLANYTYEWTTPTGTLSGTNIDYLITENTTIYVAATGQKCEAEQIVDISVYQPIEIPNGFSPNEDHKNDTWEIPGLSGKEYVDVLVYNRQGHIVYESHSDYSTPWDGKDNQGHLLRTDTYFYIITVQEENDIQFTGNVTLIR